MIRWTTVALTLALWLAVPPPAAAQEIDTLAHQRFLRGLQLFDTRRFDEALQEFRASYDLRSSPNSRLYIARALRALGQMPEAVTEYETTVAEAAEHAQSDPRYRATVTAARDELREIEGQVGRVALTVTNPTRGMRVRVGARTIPPAALGLAIPITPGTLEVVVEAPGGRTAQRTVEVAAGQRVSLSLTLSAPTATTSSATSASMSSARTPTNARRRGGGAVPEEPPFAGGEWLLRGRGPVHALTVASLGVGIVGFAAFGVLYGVTDGLYNGVSARCGGGACPESERQNLATGRTLQFLTNGSLALGITGLVTGVTLFLVGPRVEPATAVQVSVAPGTVTLTGRF